MSFIKQSSLLVAFALSISCASFFEHPGTPLARAADRGDLAAVRTLLSEGADVRAFDESGQTALHWAARGGGPTGPHREHPASGQRLAVIAALLDAGADIDAVDRRPRVIGGSSGWTPLVLALHHQQFGAATLLLERGADPNIRSREGLSAMEVATREHAPADLVALLVARGYREEAAAR
ncbi:MAG: ankyrin repeat domain-containing protein [Vicinamibacterales bacterium]